MAINIDSIFESGYADLDVLKATLKEISSELENIKQRNLPNLKYNEKIDLLINSDVISIGDDAGKFYIDLANSVLNPQSINIVADRFLNNQLVSESISQSFIEKVEGNRIIFTSNFILTNCVNIFVSYNY